MVCNRYTLNPNQSAANLSRTPFIVPSVRRSALRRRPRPEETTVRQDRFVELSKYVRANKFIATLQRQARRHLKRAS